MILLFVVTYFGVYLVVIAVGFALTFWIGLVVGCSLRLPNVVFVLLGLCGMCSGCDVLYACLCFTAYLLLWCLLLFGLLLWFVF